MGRSSAFILIGLMGLCHSGSESQASGCPNLVNYQGRVTDTVGAPVSDGPHSFEFSIFSTPSGGSALWTESAPLVTSDGLFNHLLGSAIPLPTSLFPDNDALYVEVEVDGETLPTRAPIVAVGYARRVNTVQGAAGGTIVGDVSVNGSAHVTGSLSRDFSLNTPQSAIPIAYAFINADGSLASGTSNVASLWNAVNSRYEVTIAGESYSASSYVTVVTPRVGGAPEALFATTNSSGGALLVRILSSSTGTTGLQKDFQFITYKP